ncbi:preprotein translocase subunit SecE [Buchnera aphidicola]|uniref:preprotein translocase subunit SecE n=1 Tax=Buchnera aphidicola TaxID=9 RepID=UPI0030EF6B4E
MNYINKSISIIVLITSFISFLNNSKYKKIIILKLLELKSEIKKIKWPNIQETLYMTLFIILISTIVSIILWSLDNIIMHLISYLTSLTIPLQDF